MISKRIIMSLAACLIAFMPSAMAEIKRGQAIQITISGVPGEEKGRFDQMYPVSDTGYINMPFIGKVLAAGRKAEDLAMSLQELYIKAEIYTNPTFQVFDSDQKTIEKQLVIVGGFVRRPGPVPYIRRMTLWQAVQSAGGATEFGSMNRVELTRNGTVREYDCTLADQQQILLQPGDAINVPQKNWIGN